MPEHDFGELFSQYEELIGEMQETFSSHEFILHLAQRNQPRYIEALYDYRTIQHRDNPAPFMIVHGILAQPLQEYPHLVQQGRIDARSQDIFGQLSECSEWHKI